MSSRTELPVFSRVLVLLMVAMAAPGALAEWPVGLGGPNADETTVVKVGKTGDVFVAGHFRDTMEVDGRTLIGQGLQDIFVARVTQSGTLVWIESAGSEFEDVLGGIALDDANNVYLVGEYQETGLFGGSSIESAGGSDGFIAKIDGVGEWQWARTLGGLGDDRAAAVVAVKGDPTLIPQVPDSVIVAGTYDCGASFGVRGDQVEVRLQQTVCPIDRDDLFLARFSAATGVPIWAADRGDAATGAEDVSSMVIDDRNRLVLYGKGVMVANQERLVFETVIEDDFNDVDVDLPDREILAPEVSAVSDGEPTGWIREPAPTEAEPIPFSKVSTDPSNRLGRSPMLALRGQANEVQTPEIDMSNTDFARLSLKVWNGVNDYPDQDNSVTDVVREENVTCDGVNNVDRCTRETTIETGDIKPGRFFSDKSGTGQGFRVEYRNSASQWIELRAISGSGTSSGELIDFTGSNAIALTGSTVLNDRFKLRVRKRGGGGSVNFENETCTTVRWLSLDDDSVLAENEECVNTGPVPDVWNNWWHVDDFRLERRFDFPTGDRVNYLLQVTNILGADAPTLGAHTELPDSLDVRAVEVQLDADPAVEPNFGPRVLLAGDLTGSAGQIGACTFGGDGAFIARLRLENGFPCEIFRDGISGGVVEGLAFDRFARVFVVGTFTDRIDFNATLGLNGHGGGTSDVFVARYDDNLVPEWATGGGELNEDASNPFLGRPAPIGGPDDDRGLAIASDGVSLLFVGGAFRGLADFGPEDTLTSIGGEDGFLVTLGASGLFPVDANWTVGVPLVPPDGARVDNIGLPPEIFVAGAQFNDAFSEEFFSWTKADGEDARLIPLQPLSQVEIKWKRIGEPVESEARVSSVGASAWPELPCSSQVTSACFQVHVIGAPVETNPAAGLFTTVKLVQPQADSSEPEFSSATGLFTTARAGNAALVYVEGPSADQNQFNTVVEVVRSLPFEQVPDFVDGVAVEIGKKIVEPFHNEPNRNGFVVNAKAYYDGFGADAAYNRASRTGQIIPVNRYSLARTQEQDRDLVVAWYRANPKGVFWPARAVRYEPFWPLDPDRIVIASEQGGEVQGQQPLDPEEFPSARIYFQNDFDQPGYNPNDEHAFIAPTATNSGFDAVFALRADFGSGLDNDPAAASDPYTLVKYFDEAVDEWKFRVFRVDAIGAGFTGFNIAGTAGTTINPPYPVSLLGNCLETSIEGQAVDGPPPAPFFQDYTGQLWGKSDGTGRVFYHYAGTTAFFTDTNNDDVNDFESGECIPWMPALPENDGGSASVLDPIPVAYQLDWPEQRPLLVTGETLLTQKFQLPNIIDQAGVEVVFDELQDRGIDPEPSDTLAQLIDPLNPRTVFLPGLSPDIGAEPQTDGTVAITGSSDGVIKLPVSIADRLRFDPLNGRLTLTGIFDDSGAGEPFVLLNVLSKRDRVTLKTLDGGDGSEASAFNNDCSAPGSGCDWDTAVEALFRLSRNPQRIERICTSSDLDPASGERVCNNSRSVTEDDVLIGLQDESGIGILTPFRAVGIRPALTAGFAQGSGKLTLAFNNDPALGPLPVSLEIIDVGCQILTPPGGAPRAYPLHGQVNVFEPQNIFDEQLVLRHSGDFGGNPDALEFQWFFRPDTGGVQPPPPDPENGILNGWIEVPLDNPQGAVEISIQGANIRTLSDNWYLARYRGLPGCDNQTLWSSFAGSPGGNPLDQLAQLAEGWIKRVLDRLNPFEARVQNFGQAATNNFASMLIQLGERFEGPIALNNDPDNLNNIGLIEAYTTVMRRAMQLSVDGTPPVDFGPANNAILLVASRIVDFYTLLGNEAFADAQDPTIGITTGDGSFSLAPSIFNFQNQLATLLEEELVLLRGRDTSNGPVTARPVYNRLFWNFTTGDGEVAYSQSYNIDDVNNDGVLDEFDARIQFPQGHGDAWGHYLTGMRVYYDLLLHPFFSWEPRPEAVQVAGVPITVDFLDERQFAETAAAKARTGAELVDLTYRSRYVEDPAGQWQGYTDTNTERAWGLSEWGRRAGMGAYFDWLTVNAIVPVQETDALAEGIQRIERDTLREIGEIASHSSAIQAQVDKADAGLNPLGLATGVVPFDIDPSQLDRFNKTQFEQVTDRAMGALQNAVNVWDYANELSRQMRRNQNTVDDLRRASIGQENDFSNQLIEIFGYPYADDIGPGGSYPAGYIGPDTKNHMLVDVPELVGTAFDFDSPIGAEFDIGRIQRFTGVYGPSPNGVNFDGQQPTDGTTGPVNSSGVPCSEAPFTDGCPLGEPSLSGGEDLEVEYVTIESPDIGLWFTKPPEWTGQRRAPGRLQQILQQMLQARIALRQSQLEYDKLRLEIEAQIDTVQATFDLAKDNIRIAKDQRRTLQDLTIATETMRAAASAAHRLGQVVDAFTGNIKDCIPKSMIFGMSNGGDTNFMARCMAGDIGITIAGITNSIGDSLDINANAIAASKEDVSQASGIKTLINDTRLNLFNASGEIDALIRREPILRAEIFARVEAIKQLMGNYRATLAEGQRLMQRQISYRRQGAAEIQEFRFQDMAFRIFRNEALQKYRAAFDLAARYVYLAAAAYDYETNLLGSDAQAGQRFLTDIVRQRNLGQIISGEPMPGTPGLADSMAQLKLNFDVLKGQMGFNNPQVETNRFSLRRELFRIPEGPEGDVLWREKLAESRVDDLWAVPEFQQFARPFAPRSAGPQPGLVIEFTTNVTFGMNFFGWELGAGDSSYDSSQFATRIRSVGTWFKDYAGLPLAETPRIYMFPTGADVLRAPSADDFSVRDWQVVDQAIPIPFPVGQTDLERFDWLPITDNMSGSPIEIRRYPRFPAFHFAEPFDDSQVIADSRLVGRSVWNRNWMIVIPGGTFLNDADVGLDTFIDGALVPGSATERDGQGVDDILIFFKTYAYSGR